MLLEEEIQLHEPGLLTPSDGISSGFNWTARGGIFRPTLSAYQCLSDGLIKSAGRETYLKFVLPTNEQPKNPLINARHIQNAAQEGEKVLALPRKATDDPSIFEVELPCSVALYEVMRRFFHCQKIDGEALPRGIELFAQEYGMVQLFRAFFLCRIKRHFGFSAVKNGQIKPALEAFMAYRGVVTNRIPRAYFDYFAQALAIEFDDLDSSTKDLLQRGRGNIFMFCRDQNHLKKVCRFARDVGSQHLALFLLDFVLEYYQELGRDELITLFGLFDWRNSQLRSRIASLDESYIPMFRCLALSTADFRIPGQPIHVFQVSLPHGFYEKVKSGEGCTANFSAHETETLLHGYAEEALYEGYRIYQHDMYSIYVIRKDSNLHALVFYIKHQFRFRSLTESPWIEVSFCDRDCSCVEGTAPEVRWARKCGAGIWRPAFEMMQYEGATGPAYVIMNEGRLRSWLNQHTKDCSIFLRVLYISDGRLANPNSLGHIPHFREIVLSDADLGLGD